MSSRNTQHATRNTQHATRHRSSIAALLSGLLLVSVAVHAQDQEILNEEGPYLEGVFAREAGPPLILPAKMSQHEPAPLFDAEGNSNSVIVLLDLENPAFDPVLSGKAQSGDQLAAEQAVLKAINAKEQATEILFSRPERARFLISSDRLDPKFRALLKADDPTERLHRYLVLRYPSVESAMTAADYLQKCAGVLSVEIDRKLNFLWAPNDPYFPINSVSAGLYQWGMHAMNFTAAWDRTKGHGYVAVADGGFLDNQIPADLATNYRSQFSEQSNHTSGGNEPEIHGTHVFGIVGATAGNGNGVAGGCPTCSVAMFTFSGSVSYLHEAINKLVANGMQVINMSFGNNVSNCTNQISACNAIENAVSKDVLLVAAAGNEKAAVPDFPAKHPSVFSVGGVENINPAVPGAWVPWSYNLTIGSNYASLYGVVAPAKSIVSTMPAGLTYDAAPYALCSDAAGVDQSGVAADGYGSCTGTSMATPHVSALAGILRSINPRLSHAAIQERIRASGSHYPAQTEQLGTGLPNARAAVDQTIAQTPNKLAPLFSMYSSGRLDYFYTTVPQMARAAALGTLKPVNFVTDPSAVSYASVGTGITGYGSFPGGLQATVPKAQVWLFTTPENPKGGNALAPLYRLSWKCGDPTSAPPTICSSNASHIDVTYTADTAGVNAFKSVGYKLDGIEGYLYPKTMTQPTGTVRLMRKYNPARDDHAIFPESQISAMSAQGYTQNSGSDWIGYVYPNTNGNVPTIN